MDKYTKAVLTVIAVSLAVVAFKLVQPRQASYPTFGDLLALREIKDDAVRRDAFLKIVKSVPLVRVQGGQVDADVTGNVQVDH